MSAVETREPPARTFLVEKTDVGHAICHYLREQGVPLPFSASVTVTPLETGDVRVEWKQHL